MYKIIGKWTPNPDYVGNNIKFEPLTIDEQIENEKFFYARRMADLEEDYERHKAEITENSARKLAELQTKKATQASLQVKA